MPENKSLLKILNAIALSAGVSAGAVSSVEAATTPEERTAYEAATSAGTIDSLQEFLILFPDSELAPRVFEQLNAKIVKPEDPRIAPAPIDPDISQLALGLLEGGGPTTTIY